MDRTTNYPYVLSVAPTLDDDNVPALPVIQVRFNQEMDTAGFSTDINLNKAIILIEEDTDEHVDLTFTDYDSIHHILSFTPVSNLTVGAKYQVTILDILVDTTQRQLKNTKVWSFQVSEGPLSAPTVLYPGQQEALTTVPNFTWSGSGDTFTIQIANSREFEVGSILFESTLAAFGITPSVSITGTAFWRVLATSGSINSAWSDIREFWIGVLEPVSPDSDLTYPGNPFPNKLYPGGTVPVSNIYPLDDALGYTDWPTISASWGIDLTSGTITVVRHPVDDRPTEAPYTVTGATTLDSDNQTLIWTNGAPFKQNSRYEVTATAVAADNETILAQEVWTFYTKLTPLYIGIYPIREDLGRIIDDVSDAFITFQIYRGSVRANRLIYRWFPGGTVNITFGNFGAYFPSLQQLEQAYPGCGYSVLEFVRLFVEVNCLKRIRHDRLILIDRQRSIGDFSEADSGERFLKGIDKSIDELTSEMKAFESDFGRRRTHSKSGTKSAIYTPARDLVDHWYDPQRRTKY